MSYIQEGKAHLKENELGVQDTLAYGLFNVKSHLKAGHPLEVQEKNYQKLEDQNTMTQIRLSQGLYAPFKLEMERSFAKKIGRLPCLKSSNLMLNVLRGTDDALEIEDILNNQREFGENNIDPHALFGEK